MIISTPRRKKLAIVWCCLGLGCPLGAQAFGPRDFARPLLTVPRLTPGPAPSGGIESPAWRGAAKLFGFTDISTGAPAACDTIVMFGYDRAALYVGFRCLTRPGVQPVVRERSRDGKVWADDSVELYLAPVALAQSQDYYQFIVNAGNTQLDTKTGNANWNAEWESFTQLSYAGSRQSRNNGWACCLRVPFASIGLGGPPKSLRFAAARTVISPKPQKTALVWNDRRMYVLPNGDVGTDFGTLAFGPRRAAAAIDKAAEGVPGEVCIAAEAVVLPKSKFAFSLLSVLRPDGRVAARSFQRPRFDSPRVIHHIKGLADGRYRLRYVFGPAGEAGAMPAYYAGQAGAPSAWRISSLSWPYQPAASPGRSGVGPVDPRCERKLEQCRMGHVKVTRIFFGQRGGASLAGNPPAAGRGET